MTTYTHLFNPIQIGTMSVKNRIFMPPVSTHLADEQGNVTPELLAYYRARAKGGVGLITVPSVLIDKYSRYGTYRNVCLYESSHVDNLKKLTDCVHAYDTRICAQLLHPAMACPPSYNEGRQPVAASPVEGKIYPDIPRELTISEIKDFVVKFGKAALYAKQAGFDAVEVHCCHKHGLLGNFLSPLHNKRIDAYGGNIDGRLKMPLEVIAEIRKQVGPDYPIIVRMSATDEQPGGQSIIEGMYISKKFEEAGVSMIHLSDGSFDILYKTTGPIGSPQGFNYDFAARIKNTIRIPLGVVGRINEPWVGEMMLQQNVCDVVYIGRALVADPDFPAKAFQNHTSDIRPCIGCLRCLYAANNDLPFMCAMNPEAGHENEIVSCHAPVPAKKLLVIGGGPAGLTAAYHAAKCGHQVTLTERADRLGGQMYIAAFPPTKQEMTKGTKYLIQKVTEEGVTIHLNTDITAEEILASDYDHVLIANGNDAIIPGFLKGANQVFNARDILTGKHHAGKTVVIVGAGLVGCETADFLLKPQNDMHPLQRQVYVIEQDLYPAKDEKTSARTLLIERLLKKGCHLLMNSTVKNVSGSTVAYECNDTLHTIDHVDVVISAVGSRQDLTLKEQLDAAGVHVTAITDTINIQVATRKGYDFVYQTLMD